MEKSKYDLIASRILKDDIKTIEMIYLVSINILPEGEYEECEDTLELSLIADRYFSLPMDDENFNEELHKFIKYVEVYEKYINKFNKINDGNGIYLDSSFEITTWDKENNTEYYADISEVTIYGI